MCAVSFPHYFLLATGHLAEQLKTREWIVARITSITERVVDQRVKINVRQSSRVSFYFRRIQPVIRMVWVTASNTTCWRSRTGLNLAKLTNEDPIRARSLPFPIRKASASRRWPRRNHHRFLRGHLRLKSKTRLAPPNHPPRTYFQCGREQTQPLLPDGRHSHDYLLKRHLNHLKSRQQWSRRPKPRRLRLLLSRNPSPLLHHSRSHHRRLHHYRPKGYRLRHHL